MITRATIIAKKQLQLQRFPTVIMWVCMPLQHRCAPQMPTLFLQEAVMDNKHAVSVLTLLLLAASQLLQQHSRFETTTTSKSNGNGSSRNYHSVASLRCGLFQKHWSCHPLSLTTQGAPKQFSMRHLRCFSTSSYIIIRRDVTTTALQVEAPHPR